MKHTPGPWKTEGANPITVRADHPLTKKSRIASVHYEGVDVECCKANAHLIAAAPELLEALKELQKQIFAHHKMNVKKDFSLLLATSDASKAINKAENG